MLSCPQVPEFRVSMAISTDALDSLYRKLKPKGVTMTALLAKVGWTCFRLVSTLSPKRAVCGHAGGAAYGWGYPLTASCLARLCWARSCAVPLQSG